MRQAECERNFKQAEKKSASPERSRYTWIAQDSETD